MVQVFSQGQWSLVPIQMPSNVGTGTTLHTALSSLSCAAPGSCVIAGQYETSDGRNVGLIGTLVGSTLTVTEAPTPADAGSSQSRQSTWQQCPAPHWVPASPSATTRTPQRAPSRWWTRSRTGPGQPAAAPFPPGQPQFGGVHGSLAGVGAPRWGAARPLASTRTQQQGCPDSSRHSRVGPGRPPPRRCRRGPSATHRSTPPWWRCPARPPAPARRSARSRRRQQTHKGSSRHSQAGPGTATGHRCRRGPGQGPAHHGGLPGGRFMLGRWHLCQRNKSHTPHRPDRQPRRGRPGQRPPHHCRPTP